MKNIEDIEGGNMQKELFPQRAFEVKFYGVDMPGVPKGKGLLTVRLVTRERDEQAIIEEAKAKHPDPIPENVRCTVKELPSLDPFSWKS